MADELRPKPVPKPVPTEGQLRPDQLPGEGRPPLPSGEPVVSDFVRKNLMAAGWKDGDPIPGDLGARLKALQNEIRNSPALQDTEAGKNWKPVQTSFVSIEDLPEEQKAKVASYLAEYKQQVETEKATQTQATQVDQTIPAGVQGQQRDMMREQIMQAMAAKAQADSVVIDDRQQPKPESGQNPDTFGQPEPEPEEEFLSTGEDVKTHCQRCNWPFHLQFDIEITDRDKQSFVAAALGIGRFEKQYTLLGGSLMLYFRSLTTKETEQIQLQLGHMVRTGASVGDGDFWANLMQFRLGCSLSKVIAGGNVVYDAPPLDEWASKNPPKEDDEVDATDIPRYLNYFKEQSPQQELVRRVIGQQFQKFQRLVEALEVMADDPDFWEGIGQLA